MKLVIVAAALVTTGAPPAAVPAVQKPPAAPAEPSPAHPTPVLGKAMPGCTPILRQVQEESKRAAVRRGEARTLDREPSAHLLLAVDRSVDGCREVTFLRRNAAPGAVMPNLPAKPR